MKCPVCEVDLVMSERQGIEIDYCPKCRGVWLDRGELDKIVERANAYEAARPEPDERPREYAEHREPERRDDRDRLHDRDSDRERGYDREHDKQHKRKKPGSFLSDIFESFGE